MAILGSQTSRAEAEAEEEEDEVDDLTEQMAHIDGLGDIL